MDTYNQTRGFIQKNNTQFYNSQLALRKIAALQANQTRIYGIDGFELTENKTQPFLEHSIDFGKSIDNWDQASAFIEAKAHLGLMFEIISDEY
ncbi:hypothetical protein [Paenibacillus hunanensis]|uniref:Uncharacterized protein n=1 Tax=Paenibacillus hunanensis TaxID=539262 RepID=A0ABU1J2F2_9BACL|nr:hypothetical protein [Paenibacillus hunanensis]MDR6245680.1 hypothetical protein [Paenibacillus hunanensis]GGJ28093.1 hypothetical protein GCM10008022_41150 [Paenibacillus hunanensis]